MTLRDEMPTVAMFVDGMREAFGREQVDAWMLGRSGGAFWCGERGREWGVRPQPAGARAQAIAEWWPPYAHSRAGAE